MQMKVARQKLRVREIPVDYQCRIAGVSKVSGDFRASIKAAVRILGVVLRIGFTRNSTR